MELRSSWHEHSYYIRVIVIAAILVAFLSGGAGAQQTPPAGNPEATPAGPQENKQDPPAGSPEKAPSDCYGASCPGCPLSPLHLGDFKAGIFWGSGNLTVDRLVAPGPFNQYQGSVMFAGFKHRTDTGLDDTFLGFEGGFRWGEKLSIITGLDTNMGRNNQFRQATDATAAESYPGGNAALGMLYLPVNTRGLIALPDRNSIWNWDQGFAIRVKPKVQFLLGWKYSSINNSPASYSGRVPANTFQPLPGLGGGWENFWADSSLPSTTNFTFAQRVWWTGPYLGAHLKSEIPRGLPGQWYIEGKFAPYIWGNYKYAWRSWYGDPFGGFLSSQETMQTGLSGYMMELKGGAQFRLVGNLYLEIWAKYMHLNMTGSGREMQAWQNSYASLNAFWTPFVQQAMTRITVNENLWAFGPNLLYRF